jgi:hypothetical protein
MKSFDQASDLNRDADGSGEALPVMPAKAGIQPFVAAILDSRLRGNDTISGCDSV